MKLEVLMNEMVTAMKNKDRFRKDTISSIVSAVKINAINSKQKDNISEELVNATLLKEVKTIQEMIDTCPESRQDLKEQYKAMLDIVNEFAPKLIINEDEISDIIDDIGLELTKSNRGHIMKELKNRNVDMKAANKVLSELLK